MTIISSQIILIKETKKKEIVCVIVGYVSRVDSGQWMRSSSGRKSYQRVNQAIKMTMAME